MWKKFTEIFDESLPELTWGNRPETLKTRKEWKRSRRKVRKGQKPVARLTWEATETLETECYQPDGTVTEIKERVPVIRECGLFVPEQTVPYRGTRRTWAIDLFRRYFVELSSNDSFIWWADSHWITCEGRLQEWQLKKHLKGSDRYGVRGGKWTRFLALDLDLHNGDPAVFLDQLRVLLDEFHGKAGWHYQVADQNAGGIHFIRCFRKPARLRDLREELRRRLQELDRRHPELAARARAANMKTLAELEIFPNPKNGFRLPLCSGRTMLLDRPLPPVFNKRMKRKVPDVLGYNTWLSTDADARHYMPAEQVFQFVKERLATPQLKEKRKAADQSQKPKDRAATGMADLGPMRAQYRQKLVEFWTGRHTPANSLNQGICLLARVLPFYLDDEEDAIGLIERYIDELPDVSFSDRLAAGRRGEVSRVVRHTVRTVYQGNGGQPHPETSTRKLGITVAAWKKRGFDPTDQTTWGRADYYRPDVSINNFFWKGEDIIKLGQLQKILNSSLDMVSTAVKHLLNLVKKHTGEIAMTLVKKVLESSGIACGHHGKANAVMRLLNEWNWIYVRAYEKWYAPHEGGEKKPGRARSYGIGPEMLEKFEVKSGGSDTDNKQEYLYIVSHHFPAPEPILVHFQPSGDDISRAWP